MMRAMWSAAAGMNVQQFNMDTISNNLANVNTTGFKKARAEFQDLLYQTVNLAGTSPLTSPTIPAGPGVPPTRGGDRSRGNPGQTAGGVAGAPPPSRSLAQGIASGRTRSSRRSAAVRPGLIMKSAAISISDRSAARRKLGRSSRSSGG